MTKSLTSKFLAGALLTCAASAMAAPVAFDVTAASLTPGAGYGVDAHENSGTLLDVLFTTGFSAQNFSLASVGDQSTFLVGTLDFRESNGNGGILAAETDFLGVTASLTFASPLGSTQTLTTTGVATAGSINGGANDSVNGGVDYSLTWAALTNIAFGTGGLFDISLNPITFSDTSDPNQNLSATVTLRALSATTQIEIAQPAAVPEPGSLALFAAALTLAGLTSRRRRGTGV
jgi:hypothetical protein